MTEQADDVPTDRVVGSDRVLAVLVALAQYPGGVGLDELARVVSSPKTTVHRALASLVRAGLAAKEGVGHYALGDEFLRLAFAHHETRPDHVRILPALQSLAERMGETTHYAVLDGDDVVYRAKVDSPAGAVRLTSTIGGRNPAYCTGVGKLLLARRLHDDAAARRWLDNRVLTARTPHTIVEPDAFIAEMAAIRAQGYAVDNQENELGINCVAVPAGLPVPAGSDGAVSVSALVYRNPLAGLVAQVEQIKAVIAGAASV